MTFFKNLINIIKINYKNLFQYVKTRILKKKEVSEENKKSYIFNINEEKKTDCTSCSLKMFSSTNYALIITVNDLPINIDDRLQMYNKVFSSFFKSQNFYRNFKTYKIIVLLESFIRISGYIYILDELKQKIILRKIIEKYFPLEICINEVNDFISHYDKMVYLCRKNLKKNNFVGLKIEIK